MPLSDYQPVIGLEVHAQLLTRSKLFSSAAVAFGAEPNTHTTEVCLGFPGALPVLNAQVVELAVRAGLALDCTVNEKSEWSRKHYFYPDSPKGYQITQYEFPICEWGGLALPAAGKRVQIRRIHIEEDAGKSVHDAVDGLTLVDLNRVGTPLLEIVSEPDLRSADEAVEYLKLLRDVLVYVGVNDGNLEEGSFRCDANVSLMKKGATVFGTRCELKNLNSFRNIKLAIDVEIARHVEVLDGGGAIVQETRLFDAARGETRSMRSKEAASPGDYFDAHFDADEDALVFRRLAGKEDWLAVRQACPVSPDDVPARRREPARRRTHAMSWLLDTDVISQPAKRLGSARVTAWLEQEQARCPAGEGGSGGAPRTEDRRDGQQRRRARAAALRDPPPGQAGRSGQAAAAALRARRTMRGMAWSSGAKRTTAMPAATRRPQLHARH